MSIVIAQNHMYHAFDFIQGQAHVAMQVNARPRVSADKESSFNPQVGKIPWRRKWQHIPVFFPGKSHRQRNLAVYSSWSLKESDTTEQLHFSLLQAYAIFSDSKEFNYGVNMVLITHQNPSIHRFKILFISLKLTILWNVLMSNTR